MKATAQTLLIGLALAATLLACKGTSSSEGEAGSGTAGAMAGQGGTSGASGGTGGASGTAGTSAGSSGGGTGGRSGSGGTSGGSSGGGGTMAGGGSGGEGGEEMMDAAVADSGTMQPASCASGTYLLCEDFEGTAVGQIPAGWNTLGEPVAVTDTHAVSGTHSLECGPQNDGARRIWRDTSSLPTTHWGRVRFKVKLPVPDAFVHSTIVEFKGTSPIDGAHPDYRVVDTVKEQIQGFTNNGDGNHYQFLYNVQPYADRGETGRGGGYDRKFDDQWHCAEWYIDSAEQAYRFFFDGEELEELAIHNGSGVYDGPHEGQDEDDTTEIPDVFDEVSVGWTNYQSAPPGFTAWIDDFAIATERVTCD